MTSKKLIIIANWKMNPLSVRQAQTLAEEIEKNILSFRKVDVVIAPPALFIPSLGDTLKKTKLGAQDAFWEPFGPYTGQISWRMLKSIGVSHVIIGHSERKKYGGETHETINKKVRAVLEAGLIPILCIGEQERIGDEIPRIVEEQLLQALIGVKKDFIHRLVIAYEPVWAISTSFGSRPDTPDNAFRTVLYIRKIVSHLYTRKEADSVRIIYGGSVSSSMIQSFFTEGAMQGALVGKASLDSKEFGEIVRIASKI